MANTPVEIGDYYVPDHKTIPRIKQNRQMNCWLYVTTMLQSWKHKTPYSTEYVLHTWKGSKALTNLGINEKTYVNDANDEDFGGLQWVVNESSQTYDDGKTFITSPKHVDLTEVSAWFGGFGYTPMGLQATPAQNQWYTMLVDHGPIIFFETIPYGHVQLLIGTWSGNGTLADQMIIINPATGKEERLIYEHFLYKVKSFTNIAGWGNALWIAHPH